MEVFLSLQKAEVFCQRSVDVLCKLFHFWMLFCMCISTVCLLSWRPWSDRSCPQAVALLKPGGVLVYSTCTVTLAENEEQVAWALETFPGLQLQHQVRPMAALSRWSSRSRKRKCGDEPRELHEGIRHVKLLKQILWRSGRFFRWKPFQMVPEHLEFSHPDPGFPGLYSYWPEMC